MITFAHPWFLLTLPFALGPTLLHLLSRRKLKQIEFSSLFFLRRMRERRFRWLRLRDLVLLLLRTLFLLVVLLALAGPSFQARFPLGRTRADLVIILDDSYSTAARFEKLKNTALRLVNELTPQSRVALITPSGASWDSAWTDPVSVAARIEKLEVSCSGRSLECAWNAAQALLEKSRSPSPKIAVISDGQARALEFLKRKKPPQDFRIMCFLDDKGPAPNVSVLDASLEPEFPLAGEGQVLEVRLSGSTGRTQTGIRLKSGSQIIEERMIGMGGRGDDTGATGEGRGLQAAFGVAEKSVGFGVPETAGNLSVSIDDDSIPQDNERFVLAGAGSSTRIALVRGSDSDMLELALRAFGGFDVSDFSPQTVPSFSLGGFDLVIWDGAQGLPAAALEAARRGLPVLVLLEGNVESVPGVFEAKTYSASPGFETIRQSSFFSPIDETDLAQVKVFKFSSLEPRGGVVKLYLSSGEPLIIKDTARNITYVAMRFAPPYTDIVYKGLFPLVVQKIVAYARGGGSLDHERYVGETLSVRLLRPDPVVVETPSVQYELTPLSVPRGYEARFASTGEPGFYRIGLESFVVNPDPGEASMARTKTAELKKLGFGVYPLEMSAPRNLTLLLLVIAVLALAAEFVLIFV